MSFPPTVGRYRIDRVLGSGAFASVWLGHDEALDSQVAIKVLSGSLIDDLDVRNRFLEEARILRRADSERLVRVHDIGELPDGRPYFVMSYADRGTLADRMRERPLPVSEALVLAEEIAHGVEVINALGVIHRDLKPSNVLFQSTSDGGEKLLIADLGLAKALAHASGAFTLPVGTPGYMSPEQARFGGGLDVRADVYGLGALTYHMLAGKPPGPAPIRTPPSKLREGLPPALDQVILRALEVERDRRWPTAEAFAEALATLRPTLSGGEPAPAAGPPELEETVRDEGREPPRRPMPPPPQNTGRPPHAPPRASAGHQVQPEPPTREDAPAANNPAMDGDQTIVDQPHNAQYPHPGPASPRDPTGPAGRPVGPSTTGRDADAERTISLPAPDMRPQGGPPPADEGKTAVFQSPGQGQYGPPPQGGQPYGPPGGFPPPGGQGGPPGPQQGPQGPPQGPQGPQGPPQGQQGPPQGRQGPQGPSPVQNAMGRLKGLGSGKGSGDGRNTMLPLIIGTVLLTVAVIGGLLLGNLFSGGEDKPGGDGPKPPALPADFTTVADPSKKIQVGVPKAWPLGTAENTWTPSAQGLPADARPRPVLRAAPSVAAFKGNGKGAGVFVGLTTDLTSGPLPARFTAHAQCTKGAPENYTSPDKSLSGTVTRYTSCTVGTPKIAEIGLKDRTNKFGAWIRIKETDPNRDLVKPILDSLKITAP
nr:serine/threonine protein kinase [Actinomadura kijaniata]